MFVHLMLFALVFWLFFFEFKFHIQTQKLLFCFSPFSLSLLSFGPSPAGHLPFSPFLLFLPPAARPTAIPLSSLSLPSRSPPTPRPSRPRPFPPFFPSLTRARPNSSPRPIGALLLRPLSLARGPHRSDTPSPCRSGLCFESDSPAPRDRHLRLGPARPGALSRPYLSRRTSRDSLPHKPQPLAPLTLAAAPRHRRLCRSHFGPPPHRHPAAARR
jgi:hypothetical protein